MPPVELAEVGALLGALGTLLVLVPRHRFALVVGLALLGAAEFALVARLLPGDGVSELASPLAVFALVVGVAFVGALAFVFVRFPATALVALLAAAPFRVPVEVGGQDAFLLVPLYVVLAAAVLALAYRAVRGRAERALPLFVTAAVAAFVALSAVSLLWALDPRDGAVELVFFLFPFAALFAVVARSPLPEWLPRSLATTLVALASLFALIGLWQAATQRVFFAPDIEVANAYSTFFRVTSLFKDPSLYGRSVVVAIVVLLVALWLRRVGVALAAATIALLFAGLFFSYSQSSFATLFLMTALVTFVLADRRTRILVAGACVAGALVTAIYVGVEADDASARQLTSGRSRLISVTLPLIREHPVAGVGVGSQLHASNVRVGADPNFSRNASHTTPLTVAAELGALGIAAYVAFLAAAGAAFVAAARRNRPLALAAGAVFATLVIHSLVYAGFFEDPLTWGALALAAAAAAAPDRPAALAD